MRSVALLLLAPSLAHADTCGIPADADKAFAAVTGAKAEHVDRLATSHGAEILIGRTKGKLTAAWVTLDKGRCAGGTAALGDGTGVSRIGVVNLDATHELYTGTDWDLPVEKTAFGHPALLVSIDRAGGSDVALLSIPTDPGRLLVRQPFHGNIELIEMELVDDSRATKDLVMTFTAMGGSHPGPPQKRTFHWKDGAYAP
jgi:hypothetical protein